MAITVHVSRLLAFDNSRTRDSTLAVRNLAVGWDVLDAVLSHRLVSDTTYELELRWATDTGFVSVWDSARLHAENPLVVAYLATHHITLSVPAPPPEVPARTARARRH